MAKQLGKAYQAVTLARRVLLFPFTVHVELRHPFSVVFLAASQLCVKLDVR